MPELHSYPDTEIGRCRSCGFLAKHQKKFGEYVPGSVYFELNWDERQEGNAHQGAAFTQWIQTEPSAQLAQGSIPTKMVCLVRAAPFEVDGDIQAARAELNQDRGCLSWFAYRPGRTPVQHLDEKQMLEIQKQREAHDLKIAEMRKEFDEKALEVHKAIADASSTQALATKANVFVAGFAVFVGAAVVIVTTAIFQGNTTVNNLPPTNNIEITLPTPEPTPTPQLTPDTEESPPQPAS